MTNVTPFRLLKTSYVAWKSHTSLNRNYKLQHELIDSDSKQDSSPELRTRIWKLAMYCWEFSNWSLYAWQGLMHTFRHWIFRGLSMASNKNPDQHDLFGLRPLNLIAAWSQMGCQSFKLQKKLPWAWLASLWWLWNFIVGITSKCGAQANLRCVYCIRARLASWWTSSSTKSTIELYLPDILMPLHRSTSTVNFLGWANCVDYFLVEQIARDLRCSKVRWSVWGDQGPVTWAISSSFEFPGSVALIEIESMFAIQATWTIATWLACSRYRLLCIAQQPNIFNIWP